MLRTRLEKLTWDWVSCQSGIFGKSELELASGAVDMMALRPQKHHLGVCCVWLGEALVYRVALFRGSDRPVRHRHWPRKESGRTFQSRATTARAPSPPPSMICAWFLMGYGAYGCPQPYAASVFRNKRGCDRLQLPVVGSGNHVILLPSQASLLETRCLFSPSHLYGIVINIVINYPGSQPSSHHM